MDYKQVKQAEEEAARVKVQEDLQKEASVLVQEVSFILDVILKKGVLQNLFKTSSALHWFCFFFQLEDTQRRLEELCALETVSQSNAAQIAALNEKLKHSRAEHQRVALLAAVRLCANPAPSNTLRFLDDDVVGFLWQKTREAEMQAAQQRDAMKEQVAELQSQLHSAVHRLEQQAADAAVTISSQVCASVVMQGLDFFG